MTIELFVISSGLYSNGDYVCYSRHGEFDGKTDVVSSTGIAGAKKFYSYEDADMYFKHQLPTRARKSHKVVKINSFTLLLRDPKELAELTAKYCKENPPTEAELQLYKNINGKDFVWTNEV